MIDTVASILNSQNGAEWEGMGKDLVNVCDDIRKRFTKLGYDDNFRAALADVKDRHLFEDLMEELSTKLDSFIDKVKEVPFEDDSEISPYLEQLNGFAFNAKYWVQALKSEKGIVVQSSGEDSSDVPKVEWLSLQPKSVNFNVTPLSFRKAFEEFRNRENKPWVATSATLSINQKFDYFASQLGLEEAKTAIWPVLSIIGIKGCCTSRRRDRIPIGTLSSSPGLWLTKAGRGSRELKERRCFSAPVCGR